MYKVNGEEERGQGAHLDGITFGWSVLSSFLGWKPESGLCAPVNRPWLLYSSASRRKFKISLTGLNYPFQSTMAY